MTRDELVADLARLAVIEMEINNNHSPGNEKIEKALRNAEKAAGEARAFLREALINHE